MEKQTSHNQKRLQHHKIDVDKFQGTHALESDWRDIFHWVMPKNRNLLFVDNSTEINEDIPALWYNHVLTVLLDIRHKNLKEYAISGNGEGCDTKQDTF